MRRRGLVTARCRLFFAADQVEKLNLETRGAATSCLLQSRGVNRFGWKQVTIHSYWCQGWCHVCYVLGPHLSSLKATQEKSNQWNKRCHLTLNAKKQISPKEKSQNKQSSLVSVRIVANFRPKWAGTWLKTLWDGSLARWMEANSDRRRSPSSCRPARWCWVKGGGWAHFSKTLP